MCKPEPEIPASQKQKIESQLMNRTATIIGAGVIGGGWGARFLLSGWSVNVYDPNPEAVRQVSEVLANARRSLPGLLDVALPAEGRLTFCDSIAEAVEDAEWIQESVPERLDLKREIYAEIQRTASVHAVLGSSTSGFKPGELAAGASNPGQIVVCHPFNPVYLLPLVEVVAHERQDATVLKTAQSILAELGMKPLLVRKEIDAHIADRLLEAVWREALWLVKDAIATTEEIDDAIRFGFGLRWAQMGLFETYRIAGGEQGMAHFIEQFGPCLSWPWTKLTDVPELTDELIQQIAQQSDKQSGAYSIRELERQRDNNLVAILRALKWQGWGAGQLLNELDNRQSLAPKEAANTAPILTVARAVPVDWTDYNGHMTEYRYLEIFGEATDCFMKIIGCDAEYIAKGGSYFTAESHIRHVHEVKEGTRVKVSTQCLFGKGKKMHLFHSLHCDDGHLLATGEHMLIHVSLKTRRPSSPAEPIAKKLAEIANQHAELPYPEAAGSAVGLR